MLIGYVSDENYVALGGVTLEFEHEEGSIEAHSRITGAVHAERNGSMRAMVSSRPGPTEMISTGTPTRASTRST